MNKGYIVCVYEKTGDDKFLKEYAEKALLAVKRYGGKFLIRSGEKIITEGKKFIRTVVIEFSSFEQAKKFFYSKEYQEAHKILRDDVIRHHQIIEGF